MLVLLAKDFIRVSYTHNNFFVPLKNLPKERVLNPPATKKRLSVYPDSLRLFLMPALLNPGR